jgi:hypothetical protein
MQCPILNREGKLFTEKIAIRKAAIQEGAQKFEYLCAVA